MQPDRSRLIRPEKETTVEVQEARAGVAAAVVQAEEAAQVGAAEIPLPRVIR